jgi:hypothetical protein
MLAEMKVMLKKEVVIMAERKIRQAIRLGKRSVAATIPSELAEEMKIAPKTNLMFERYGENQILLTNVDAVLNSRPKEGKTA